MWGKLHKIYRRIRRNTFLRSALFSLGVVLLTALGVLGSITGNVYLHELSHYSVAKYYGLDPEIHIDTLVDVNTDIGVRFNTKPSAYTLFSNPHDDVVNFQVTIAGPLMNVAIALLLLAAFILVRLLITRRMKYYELRHATRKALRLNTLRFVFDIIFVSLIVPTLVSIFVNFSTIPGADGVVLRELFSRL